MFQQRKGYVLEYVRDGLVVRHEPPGGNYDTKAARQKRRAIAYARVFASRLPEVGTSWGRHIGWMIRVLDRDRGLIVASFECTRRGNGSLYVRSL